MRLLRKTRDQDGILGQSILKSIEGRLPQILCFDKCAHVDGMNMLCGNRYLRQLL